MDYSAVLKGRALYIAKAIHEFARRRGWAAGEYHIFARGNVSWNILSFVVVSDHFSKDEYNDIFDDNYIDIMNSVQESVADVPGLYESMSLSLTTFDDEAGLASLYYPILGDDEVEIDFSLLNPGVDDPRAAIARGGNGN